MRGWLVLLVAVLGLLESSRGEGYVAPPLAPMTRTISTTQQFIVYYRDKLVRAKIAQKLEDLKTQWRQRLGLSDDWKAPIIVRLETLRPADCPPISTSVYESDANEMKIQIDIYEPSLLQSPAFDIEVYRALCLEYAYRQTPIPAGKSYNQPPDWLLEGLYEDSATEGSGLPSELYGALIDRGAPPRLADFLRIRPDTLDSTSREVYRAQAMGLLRAFLTFEGGEKALTAYLAKLPVISPTDAHALLAAFPALIQDPTRLTKIWVLSLAGASAANRIEPLGIDETQKQLAALLDVSAPLKPKGKGAPTMVRGPAALPAVAQGKGGAYIMREKAEELLRLEVSSHPLLRPVVQEYRLIVTLLARSPKKNVTIRLAKNGELLQGIVAKASQVTDYLNWYEAAQLNTSSGDFTTAISDSEVSLPPRQDAITRALDDVEARGW